MAASLPGKAKTTDTATRLPGRRSSRLPESRASADGMREATVHEAKTHLSRLLAEVEAGTTVVITRRGKRVAKIEALPERRARVAGSLKGLISIDDRFFEPLPDDELRAWEGG